MTNTKKYLGSIATALVFTAALVGCGSRAETTAAPTTTTTSKAPVTTTTEDIFKTAPQSLKVDALVEVFQDKFPGTSRGSAIDIANTACDAVRAQGSIVDAVAAIVADPDVDYDTAGDMSFIIGVSVPVFCPEFLAELNAITGP